MKLKQIEKKIDQHTWWLEEAPCLLQTVLWAWHGFIEQGRYLNSNKLSIGLFFHKRDYIWEFTPADEKAANFQMIVKRLERDPLFVVKMHRRYQQKRKQTLRSARILAQACSTAHKPVDLARPYHRYMEDLFASSVFSIIVENADPYTQNQIFDDIANEQPKFSPDEIREIALTMTAPRHLLYLERVRVELLNAAIEHRLELRSADIRWTDFTDQNRLAAQAFNKISLNYHWVHNNYAQVKHLPPAYFWKEAKKLARRSVLNLKKELLSLKTKPERIRQAQQLILKQYRWSPRLKRIFNVLSLFSWWQDERKELGTDMMQYHLKMIERLAELTGRPAWHFDSFGYQEMLDFLKGRGGPSPAESVRRRNLFVYVAEPTPGGSRGYVISGQPAKQLFKQLLNKVKSPGELSGVVACAPELKIRGRVQIVLDSARQRFSHGRILVTPMTRPEFMPYVRKAKAIITDEGGLTAHAAIVARELKLPCIIGTRNATRMLRDGQKVEIDLRSGRIMAIKC